jgi:hypothetical protein
MHSAPPKQISGTSHMLLLKHGPPSFPTLLPESVPASPPTGASLTHAFSVAPMAAHATAAPRRSSRFMSPSSLILLGVQTQTVGASALALIPCARIFLCRFVRSTPRTTAVREIHPVRR